MSVFETIKGWFAAKAEQIVFDFLPTGSAPIQPGGGYVRVWLTEGFLSDSKTWGNDHFPALHGGAALAFSTAEQAEFTQFTRSPEMSKVDGRQLDFALTPLLPYMGGIVEVQGALYQATKAGPLATVVSVTGALAGLAGPPLATAAAIAGKIGAGLAEVLAMTGNRPLLAAHCAFEPPGGNGRVLRAGHIVVVRATKDELDEPLQIVDGSLSLKGFDFMVLRLECRTEPDVWVTPPLRAQIDEAVSAYLKGHQTLFDELQQTALITAWTSPDILLRDRRRLAQAVEDSIIEVTKQGAVPPDARSLEDLVVSLLPDADDPELARRQLRDLLM